MCLIIPPKKFDLKNATGFYTSDFSKKADLASLKSEIGEIDISKLETTPVDLRQLSDAVKNKVVKNTGQDELVKDADDTVNLVKNAKLHTNIDDVEKKIPNNDIYITTQEFNKLTTDNFRARYKGIQ